MNAIELDPRAAARRRFKADRTLADRVAKQKARTAAKRALLERQTRREKSGFYEGQRSVAESVATSRSRVHSTKNPLKVSKSKAFGRVMRTFVTVLGREMQFHATKGWRSYRAERA